MSGIGSFISRQEIIPPIPQFVTLRKLSQCHARRASLLATIVRMNRNLPAPFKSALFAFFVIGLLYSSVTHAQKGTYRQTLAKPTEIQGHPCDKGYAWFYSDGKLQKCTVASEIALGEFTIPAGSWITLSEEGKPSGIQAPHDIEILGLICQGGGLLGPSEGSIIAFYPTGKLKVCYLAHNQPVQGVPCAHGGVLNSLSGSDPGVHFESDGALKSCRLSADYLGHHRGEIFKAGR